MTSTPHHHQRNRTTQDRSVRPFGALVLIGRHTSHGLSPRPVQLAALNSAGLFHPHTPDVISDGRRHQAVQQAPRRGRSGATKLCRVIARGSQALRIETKPSKHQSNPLHLEHLSSAAFDVPMGIEDAFADEQKVSVSGAKSD